MDRMSTLKGIQHIACIPNVRLHMRTVLAASDSARKLAKLYQLTRTLFYRLEGIP